MVKEEEKQPKGKPSLGAFIHNPIYRAERKRKLLEYVKKATRGNDETLSAKFVVGVFSFKWGISCRAVKEYLEELLDVGAILRKGDRIKFSDVGEELLSMSV